MKIGYARISTDEQSLALQHDALTAAGCAEVFEDRGVSGIATRRPGLEAALAAIGAGDVLVVWKLDRLGRSLPHLIETVRLLGARGAGFASLSESIDTTMAGGKLVFHIMGSLAEFERSLIVERVNAGIAAAKKRGKHVGRPRQKLTPEQVAHAREAIDGGLETPAGMAQLLGVDHSTLWRAFRDAERNPAACAMAARLPPQVPMSEGEDHRAIKALVKPAILRWARDRAKVKPEDAAKAAHVTVERLLAWESDKDDDAPTLGQLRSLAAAYHFPLAVFYLPEPPKDFAPLRDFRRLPDAEEAPISANLAYHIRSAYERRELALELFQELGAEPRRFPLRASRMTTRIKSASPSENFSTSMPKAKSVRRDREGRSTTGGDG